MVEPSEAGDWEAPAVGASPLTPRSPSWASARVSTEDGIEDALSERDLFLAWGDEEPPSEGRIVLHREAKPPSPCRPGLPVGALSRREALQVWTLLQAAAATPKEVAAAEDDLVSVDSEASSDEADVAVGGIAGITFVPPDAEVANAEEALAWTPEGSADAEPGAPARASRPMLDQRLPALVMHRTRRTLHRANCKFARRMADAARVDLAAAPAAEWPRCRFCCPP